MRILCFFFEKWKCIGVLFISLHLPLVVVKRSYKYLLLTCVLLSVCDSISPLFWGKGFQNCVCWNCFFYESPHYSAIMLQTTKTHNFHPISAIFFSHISFKVSPVEMNIWDIWPNNIESDGDSNVLKRSKVSWHIGRSLPCIYHVKAVLLQCYFSPMSKNHPCNT